LPSVLLAEEGHLKLPDHSTVKTLQVTGLSQLRVKGEIKAYSAYSWRFWIVGLVGSIYHPWEKTSVAGVSRPL